MSLLSNQYIQDIIELPKNLKRLKLTCHPSIKGEFLVIPNSVERLNLRFDFILQHQKVENSAKVQFPSDLKILKLYRNISDEIIQSAQKLNSLSSFKLKPKIVGNCY